jgi:hypothetical protein
MCVGARFGRCGLDDNSNEEFVIEIGLFHGFCDCRLQYCSGNLFSTVNRWFPGQPILQFEVLAASVSVRQSNGEVTLTRLG